MSHASRDTLLSEYDSPSRHSAESPHHKRGVTYPIFPCQAVVWLIRLRIFPHGGESHCRAVSMRDDVMDIVDALSGSATVVCNVPITLRGYAGRTGVALRCSDFRRDPDRGRERGCDRPRGRSACTASSTVDCGSPSFQAKSSKRSFESILKLRRSHPSPRPRLLLYLKSWTSL